jgi:hypothetical protein
MGYSKEVKQIVDSHWDKSDFYKLAHNKALKTKIINATTFLDKHYKNIQLRSRVYCIKNGIDESNLPLCESNCGNYAALRNNNATIGFSRHCSLTCHRSKPKIDYDALIKLKDYEWLYEQRIVLKKSIETLAKELNVSTGPINYWLVKHDLKDVIKNVRVIQGERLEFLQNRENLYNLYVTQNLSIKQICKDYGYGSVILTDWLNYHNIPIKNNNEYARKNNFVSKPEKELHLFVESLIGNNFISNDRKLMRGKELDVLVPSKSVGFEYNGLFSHCYRPHKKKACIRKDETYHLGKTELCFKQGVTLIHFFPPEWDENKEVAKSFIKRKLLKNDRINSNECVIRLVNNNFGNEFLKSNSILGELLNEFIGVGLYYNNELIQLTCFERFNNDWIISRIESKKDVSIIRGFKLVLDYFKDVYSGKIYAKVNRRFSNGQLLKSYGFSVVEVIKPDYYYTDKKFIRLFDANFLESYCKGRENECFYAKNPLYKKVFDCGKLLLKL